MDKKISPAITGGNNLQINNSTEKNGWQVALTVITSSKPDRLTKAYSLDEKGELSKNGGGNMFEGKSEVRNIASLTDFAGILTGLTPNQALTYGITEKPLNNIVTDGRLRAQPNLQAISRTEKHFKWSEQYGGVLMLDYDPHTSQEALSRDELVKILRDTVPALKNVKMLHFYSSSSLIYNKATGQQLTGIRGQRLYILVDRATEIKSVGEVIFKRLWLAGHGYIFISASGALLPRSLIDDNVWQPSRLDFAAGAQCKVPLEQRRGEPTIINGENEYLETEKVKALGSREEAKYKKILNDEKEKCLGESTRIKNKRIKEKLATYKEEEKPLKEQALKTAYFGGSVLTAHFEIVVIENGEKKPVTVKEILANPQKYDEATTLEPLEPEYNNYHPVGKLYLMQDSPTLHSFAHGQTIYKLVTSEKQSWFDEDNQIVDGTQFYLTHEGLFCKQENKIAFVCSPLQVVADTVGENNADWGRLLRWYDPMGHLHNWVMPNELLGGDGNDIRKTLLNEGVKLSTAPKIRGYLVAYLANSKPKQPNHIKCIKQLGWHDNCYLLPDETIGRTEEEASKIIFNSPRANLPPYKAKGTLEEWQKSVTKYAKGNNLLLFALGVAFAPVLLEFDGREGCIFHIWQGSSNGKSTTQLVAASVWGGHDFKRAWRITDNGAEGLAAMHNDNLLVLDELAQITPDDLDKVSYMITNGEGKTRATIKGEARQTKKWRIIGLSSGEITLTEHLKKAKKEPMAGQEVRFIEIRSGANEGERAGVFENTHNMGGGDNFSKYLKYQATRNFHGVAGIEFIKHICKKRESITEALRVYTKSFKEKLNLPVDTPIAEQVGRVINHFSLVAFAGELATEAGITKLEKGEIEKSVIKVFDRWVEDFGFVNKEETKLIRHVKGIFLTYGSTKFENANTKIEENYQRAVGERLGFYETDEYGERVFYVAPQIYKERFCNGLPLREASEILKVYGLLRPNKNGKNYIQKKIKAIGGKQAKYYVFTEKVLGSFEEEEEEEEDKI